MAGRKIRVTIGAPGWIITFADLSTLLLTFFVLLISFSNQDIIKFREMLGSVQGAFGVKVRREGEYQAALTGSGAEDVEKKAAEDKEKEEKLKRQLVKISESIKQAAGQGKMGDNTEVTSTGAGVLIRVDGEALFAPGSAKINSKATPFLDEIARILRKSGLSMRVEGHTDDVPMRSALYSSNWELSGARAAAVTRYLIARGAPPEHLSAVGYGDMRPIASNDTPEGRAKNRRAEFLIQKP